MTSLDRWLELATCHLAKESAAQVGMEIRDHHESERQTAMRRGATAEEADRLALTALGDARTANRQYRRVMLTSAEAGMLRGSRREAQAVCSRPWLKWLLLTAPLAAALAAAVFFYNGAVVAARASLLAGVAAGVFFSLPLLPIYTPSRAKAYRVAKWATLIVLPALAFGRDALTYSWLLASCLWIPLWTEWTRVSIRRKLPEARWPRHLYL